MSRVSASLLLGLARRTGRERPGTLRFEGCGVPRPGPVVTGSGDPDVTIVVHDPRAWSATLRGGSTGLAESYIAGWWDSDDLTAVVRLAFRRTTGLRQFLDTTVRRTGGLLAGIQGLRPPSKQRDRRERRGPLRPLQRLLRPHAGPDHGLFVRLLRQ